MADTTKSIDGQELQRTPKRRPMEAFLRAYAEGARLELPLEDLLARRSSFFSSSLTWRHGVWLVREALWRGLHHREAGIRAQYDRGNDWYHRFLGAEMAYTCAYFADAGRSLEEAQQAGFARILQKLDVRDDERFLDVGCGWGGLLLAASAAGARAVGVTLSSKQVQYARHRAAAMGLEASVIDSSYEDVRDTGFHKIACIEMVEHVGSSGLPRFFSNMKAKLVPKGRLLIQWVCLGPSWGMDELLFGLFVEMHIAPGADAFITPERMIAAAEKQGLEVVSLESWTDHYALTAERWLSRWRASQEVRALPQYDFRTWEIFLAWGASLMKERRIRCYQLLLEARSPA